MLPGDQLQDAELRRVTLTRSQRKLMGWGILAAVALVIVVVFLLTRQFSQQTNTVSTAVPATSTGTPAAALAQPATAAPQSPADGSTAQVVDLATLTQPERRAFVLKLIKQGVFTGVQATEKPPKVGVTPLFQGLSLDLKRQFIAAVEAYVHNGAATTEPLVIIDATNSKAIGNFTAADGLKLTE